LSDPSVSVVIIFYDDERFLGEAIDSVLAQTYTAWELVLADDGSSDASSQIAARYAASDPDRIHYVEHPGHANRGISATRNLGIAAARGEHVAFLDSDDVWEPTKLAEQVAIVATHPEVGLVMGASRYWWSWDPASTAEDRVRPIGAPQDTVVHPPEMALHLYPLGEGTPPCPSSCFVRRDVLERLGGFEAHMPGLYDDQGFLGKAYLATPVYVSSRCWDKYRRHPGAVTLSSSRAQYASVRRYYLDWYEGYLDATEVLDPRIRSALRRARWPYRHPRLAAVRRVLGTSRARVRRVVAARRGERR
jgi:glycosyltransferase involved in cell wall biosynthesis